MEPFVAYAAPRVDPVRRNQYLHRWEEFLLATAGDREWQTRLRALADTVAQNRLPVEEKAWAAQR
jgi:NAD(P)H dehydrogenase (quinone)